MTHTLSLQLEPVSTPLGQLLVVYDHQQIVRAIDWLDYEKRMYTLLHRYYKKTTIQLSTTSTKPSAIAALIHNYFDGDLYSLQSIPTAVEGTSFQKEVWSALQKIAPGHSVSYGELACSIHRPAAVRAVGLANGANPISLVIPCHRVIGQSKKLTGYAGGLNRKKWLLQHENIPFVL